MKACRGVGASLTNTVTEGVRFMKTETFILNQERNVSLTAYVLDVGGEFRNVTKRPGVIIIPGGGYQFCSDREADPVALTYLKAGFDAFVLRYSVGEHAVWPNPLRDYDAAMAFVLSKAEEWNLMPDKIAVVGFSAGGHLAAAAATMAERRPAAAVLGYPVIREDTAHECEKTAPGIVPYVDEKTCPCFIFATRTDDVVPIQNTLDMLEALNRYQTAFECHIYAYGPHGFSTADSSIQSTSTIMAPRIPKWTEDSIGWLKDVLGEFTENGLSAPVCKPHLTADSDGWLSLDCTIGRIFGNPKALQVLASVVCEMREKIEPFEPGMTFEDMMGILSKMTLRNLLAERGIAIERFDELDEQLGKIPNI